MKLPVTAIMEMTPDGMYSCSITENLGNYGIAGYGETAEQAREDMLACYEEMKEMNAEEGIETPEFEITYKYDIQSFFSMFPFFNISKIADEAGINKSQLRQYASGHAVASEMQYQKLRTTMNKIKEKLSFATF